MFKIAQFHKVSLEQFEKDWKDSFLGTPDEVVRKVYEEIRMPARATRGSAGYDFYSLWNSPWSRGKPSKSLRVSGRRWKKAGY